MPNCRGVERNVAGGKSSRFLKIKGFFWVMNLFFPQNLQIDPSSTIRPKNVHVIVLSMLLNHLEIIQ